VRSEQLWVLSMWQPWATLCVAPLPVTGEPPKHHETRAFAPRLPLPLEVVIHATQKWDRNNAWTATDPTFREALHQCGFLAGPTAGRLGVLSDQHLKPLPFGKIIGVATIASVDRTESLRVLRSYDLAFGDWTAGRCAWRFENVRALPEPIPFKGRQDVLWPLLQKDILDRINEQLSGVAA
jgi:hypothetical protein